MEISGSRLANEAARDRERTDRWNSLAFEPGDLLLMALRPGAHLVALAGEPVDSVASAEVTALRRAAEIERIEPADARRSGLGQALVAQEELLRNYALDALGRRSLAPRAEAAAIVAHALFSRDLPAGAQTALGSELASRNFYRYELGADPVNVEVIRSLAQLLVSSDPAHRPLWAQLLGASLTIELSKDPQKDADIRTALIRGVTDPSPQRVIEALQQQLSSGSHDPRVPKLLEAWRTAQH
jgi:hypothetical protein